jgi:NADPH-dependent curcumin reductase
MRNRQIVLVSRPVGIPQPEHFELRCADMPVPKAGEFLVSNEFLSVDPAQRGYVNDENNYVPPVPLGSVMRAMAVGKVITSRCAEVPVGQYLYGWFGWQDYCCAGPSATATTCITASPWKRASAAPARRAWMCSSTTRAAGSSTR